jgi:hypothetical protein
MLGELIYEAKGKITGKRVLEFDGGGVPKLEISVSNEGMLKGTIEHTEMWTYCTEQRPDGVQYGQGIGVMMTKDGTGEVVCISGQGVGKMMDSGILRYVGANFYSTSSTGKLAFLNNLVGLFEYDVDGSGNNSVKVWEWK